ncbi:MAG TPA: helix-turn-helix transcriptional regulator [Bacteroidales bacterium]|nr:helix-turn-helix transcriptional regulator [Bacteroidales bacterium]
MQSPKKTGIHGAAMVRYERDEEKPSIDVVKKISKFLDTTIAFLLDEDENQDLFKDHDMLRRLKEINSLPDEDKQHIIFNLGAVLQDARTRQAYAGH